MWKTDEIVWMITEFLFFFVSVEIADRWILWWSQCRIWIADKSNTSVFIILLLLCQLLGSINCINLLLVLSHYSDNVLRHMPKQAGY